VTRVNLVDPRTLSLQHLIVEWRELPRIAKACWLAIERDGIDGMLERVPPEYVMGTNHVRHFYDKGTFITNRFAALQVEMRERGVNFDEDITVDEWCVFDWDVRLRKDYIPTPQAIALSQERLDFKIAQRPHWYRFRP
jgi:deoxyribonuclease (pyrimidine dimer)